HRLGAEKGNVDRTSGFARLGLRPADQRLELLVAQLDAIEFVVELADTGAQILLIDVRIEQRAEPRQPNDPVYPGRVVNPAKWIGWGEIDPLFRDSGHPAPRPIALQRGVEAGLLRDDYCRVPCKDLFTGDSGELAAAERGGDVDNPCLVYSRHCLRAGEPGFEAVGPAAVINQGSRGRFGDQQPAAQIVDRRPRVVGEVLAALADTEHLPDDLEVVRSVLDAAVENGV